MPALRQSGIAGLWGKNIKESLFSNNLWSGTASSNRLTVPSRHVNGIAEQGAEGKRIK